MEQDFNAKGEGPRARDGDGTGETGRGARPGALDEIRRALAGQSFASIEEAQAVIDRITLRHNTRPVDDFVGLSREQMHRMLHFPFESAQVATFAEELPETTTAPVLTLFHLLVEGIGEGLKPTTTGNLPLKLVQPAALAYWGEEKYRERTRYGALRTEPEFGDLHAVRIVAGIAGLVRKYKGKFVVTRKARQMLERSGPAGAYPALLRAYNERFNWGYRDGCEEIGIIQQSFLFSMYLVHRFGDDWREAAFYEGAFLRAFPMALSMVAPSAYRTPEQDVGGCYTLRCLEHFLAFFGLVETQTKSTGLFDRIARVRKTPLLEQVVAFHT